MTNLIVERNDVLSIGADDVLRVSELAIKGSVVGNGSLETYCERLVATGVLADTVSLVCLAESLFIPEFKAIEKIFEHDPNLLFLAPIALEVPAVLKKRPQFN